MFGLDRLAGVDHRVVIADIEARRGNAGFLGEPPGCVVIARVVGDDGEAALVAQPFADRASDPARAPGYDGYP